jgi:hypothetical protein
MGANKIKIALVTDYGERFNATLTRELDQPPQYITLESATVDGVSIPTGPPVVEPPPVDPPVEPPVEPPVTTLRIVSGDGQTAAPDTRVTLVVELAGADGPIADARISFIPTSGGGRFTAAKPVYVADPVVEAAGGRVAKTGADGRAQCDWVFGSGPQTAAVTAMDHGLDVTFTATGTTSGGGGTTPPPSGNLPVATTFDTGSSAPFVDTNGSATGNQHINIMDDPTGQFVGKVARYRFQRTGGSVDVNRALTYTLSPGDAVGLGKTIFMRGEVLIPTPQPNMANAMRKLIYVQRATNDASFAVIKATGNTLKVEITGNRIFSGGSLPYDGRVALEVQITANSALGVADGILRVWKNGALVIDRSDVLWLTTTAPFKEIKFGQQTQHEQNDATIMFDEYRYWDNLAVSAQRIG